MPPRPPRPEKLTLYISPNNYIYGEISGNYYLILENELNNPISSTSIPETGEIHYYIYSSYSSNYNNNNISNPLNLTYLTQEQYNQIQAGTFHYGLSAPPPIQPILTYNLTWGTGNVFQKLSGKTYVNPSGQTVDCSSVSVTFSSSRHFKKFYATAVKEGNDYGFENDVLVDLTTGTLLYELTERDANVNFTFTINTSSLTGGDGEYRIGLYVQDDDGIWNYEYFLLEANNLQLESSSGEILQVAVNANVSTVVPVVDPDEYYELYYYLNKKYFKFNNNEYYELTDNEFECVDFELAAIQGQNIENIVHTLYQGDLSSLGRPTASGGSN